MVCLFAYEDSSAIELSSSPHLCAVLYCPAVVFGDIVEWPRVEADSGVLMGNLPVTVPLLTSSTLPVDPFGSGLMSEPSPVEVECD